MIVACDFRFHSNHPFAILQDGIFRCTCTWTRSQKALACFVKKLVAIRVIIRILVIDCDLSYRVWLRKFQVVLFWTVFRYLATSSVRHDYVEVWIITIVFKSCKLILKRQVLRELMILNSSLLGWVVVISESSFEFFNISSGQYALHILDHIFDFLE